jgi:8-oxo-dGTP diphosphatase
VPVVEVPQMVYDHNEIFDFARERLKRRVKRRPIGFRLLPREFTLGQIHSLYEQILEKRLDKRNFRKKLFSSQLLVELDKQVRVEGSKKPATLLCFDAKRYEKLTLKGYDFTF